MKLSTVVGVAMRLGLLFSRQRGGCAFSRHVAPVMRRSNNKAVVGFEASSRSCVVRLAATVPRRAPSARPAVETAYGAGAITVLEGLEAVRKRPGMYIGSTGAKGLHHLVFEIVDNAVDEVMAGHATRVEVVLHADGSCSVSDDGRGIPCDTHAQTGRSALETVLCVLHAGGKFGGESSGYRVSGGLHGVGLSVVNALSKSMDVEVRRDGTRYAMSFARGAPLGPLAEEREQPTAIHETGTRVRFTPDPDIFQETTRFEWDVLAARMDELAYLNAGARLTLRDERDDGGALKRSSKNKQGKNKALPTTTRSSSREQEFVHEGGIGEYADSLCAGKTPLHAALGPWQAGRGKAALASSARKTNASSSASSSSLSLQQGGFLASGSSNGVEVECALRWSADQYADVVVSFANGIRTGDGGTHVEGLRATLTRSVNAAAKRSGKLKAEASNIPGEFVREGLTAVLVVSVPEPEFEGQTKSRLGSPGVRKVVDSVVGEHVSRLFEWQPKALGAIVDKALAAQSAATAAKKARDLVRRKSLLATTVLPGKLADCSTKSRDEAEIFIVEGDSAAGSAKQGRDRLTQAILPLRGKILNIEKCADERIYQNAELQALMAAIGLGVKGDAFSPEALRYSRVVIMTDADVDGAHIRTLILTFFYRYQRALVHNGHVFIACPPLYKVAPTTRAKAKEHYCWSDDELAETLARVGPNAAVQRFKGLGEMMPQQLWETTMDPARRKLQRVDVADAAKADQVISLLMGDSALERKAYITANAMDISIGDIDM